MNKDAKQALLAMAEHVEWKSLLLDLLCEFPGQYLNWDAVVMDTDHYGATSDRVPLDDAIEANILTSRKTFPSFVRHVRKTLWSNGYLEQALFLTPITDWCEANPR
jgi:hypothetical protein